jgi:FkbM family methyltransferase
LIKKLLEIFLFIKNHPLTKNCQLKTIFKFIIWQLTVRLTKNRFIVRWVNNSKFIIGKSETGLTGNYYCGLMEYEDMTFILHYLRKTDFFYDIGANVGAYTILASAVIGCKTKSFEPINDTFDRLVDQIRINRIDNLVEAKNCGVSDNVGFLKFTNNLNAINKVNLDQNNKNISKVSVISLNSESIPNQDIIVKIDVEGYEKFIIDGGNKFFSNKNVKVLIIELNGNNKNYGTHEIEIHKLICSFGFMPVFYNPLSRKLDKIGSYNEKKNTIYVKDLNFTKKRCLSSPKVTIHTANGVRL